MRKHAYPFNDWLPCFKKDECSKATSHYTFSLPVHSFWAYFSSNENDEVLQ